MSQKSPVEIRMELARGHLMLGELDSAVPCLERAVEAAPDSEPLAALVRELAEAVAGGDPDLVARTDAMLARVAPGLASTREPAVDALAVAEPEELLASAERIRILEGWLENLRSRYGGPADDLR